MSLVKLIVLIFILWLGYQIRSLILDFRFNKHKERENITKTTYNTDLDIQDADFEDIS